MSKTTFVGDIHVKSEILNRVEKIFNEDKNIDKLVFLGDYVDDWNTSAKDNVAILEEIFNLKKKYNDKIVLLLGNHEMSYMGFLCSGHKPSKETEKLLHDNLDLLDVVYKTNDFIVTHGGFTELWLNMLKDQYLIEDDDKVIDKINEMFHKRDGSIMRDLNLASLSSGGYSIISSCLWARPTDHTYSPINLGKDQIIGHTPNRQELKNSVGSIIIDGLEINDKIFYIDTFSTWRDSGEPIGKEEILIFDDNTKSYYSKSLVTDREEFIYQRSSYEKM